MTKEYHTFTKGSKETDKFVNLFGSSHQDVFLGNGVLKICSKFTGEHP